MIPAARSRPMNPTSSQFVRFSVVVVGVGGVVSLGMPPGAATVVLRAALLTGVAVPVGACVISSVVAVVVGVGVLVGKTGRVGSRVLVGGLDGR